MAGIGNDDDIVLVLTKQIETLRRELTDNFKRDVANANGLSDGVFLGGVIAPGIMTSAETLTRRTSKLPATELAVPSRVIGRRTEECIQAGVMFGAAESIDGIVRRIKQSWPRPETPMVIATGGLAETMGSICRSFDRVEPHLTLQGLQIAHALLRRGNRAI